MERMKRNEKYSQYKKMCFFYKICFKRSWEAKNKNNNRKPR